MVENDDMDPQFMTRLTAEPEVWIGGFSGRDSAIMQFSLVVFELVSKAELHQIPFRERTAVS